MPGILPMKVIKVGTSAQSRIAQACDRCRSKKIRCDGFRPTCSQCANVGFECKTSDKLSRRAFPRGYTESLEERVRSLEAEVRELKDLLDEKDEKIDMLSKLHSQSPRNGSPRRPSLHSPSDRPPSQETVKDDLFKVQQSPFLLNGEGTDSFFMGNSSVRTFLDAFKRKLQESGKPCSEFSPDAFNSDSSISLPEQCDKDDLWKTPPRLMSDQMVNVFFQEWAPLFPILHRPTFLGLYEQFVANPNELQDKKALAQLHLVFSIAALSSEARLSQDALASEKTWVAALESFNHDTSIVNLQCLLLAQLYCIQKGDASSLLRYKGLAVGISHRLGLHLSQKRFALGTLSVEVRKKLFWTLYSIDCFSAASLGLPKLLKEDDIHCELPVDYDDEYVTEKGFLPTLPGEYTKLSSALALFRGSRILGRVLAETYPAAGTYELSLRTTASLDEALTQWLNDLPAHLKLEFVQDKPSTLTISSRCPFLSLTYNYIRTLIHRPAVCADLGDKASSSKVALASALKQTVQIISLLDERKLSFSYCLNKNETLLLCGFGLLYLSQDLDRDGKLMKDSQRLLCTVIAKLEKRHAQGSLEFKQLGCSMLSIGRVSASPSTISSPEIKQSPRSLTSPLSPEKEYRVLREGQSPPDKWARPSTSNAPVSLKEGGEAPNSCSLGSRSTSSVEISASEKALRPPDSSLAPSHQSSHSSLASERASNTSWSMKTTPALKGSPPLTARTPNLDYFSFSDEPTPRPIAPQKSTYPESAMWERLLDTLEETNQSREESVYDWPQMETLVSLSPDENVHTSQYTISDPTWSPGMLTTSGSDSMSVPYQQAHSVYSFSDDSQEGGTELSRVDSKFTASRGVTIPRFTTEDAE